MTRGVDAVRPIGRLSRFPHSRIRLVLILVAICISFTASAQQPWELRVCADPNRLPFSNSNESGFDNKIAILVAEELGARLVFVWTPMEQIEEIRTDWLWAGKCYAVFGVLDGTDGFLTAAPCYRSPFALTYRVDSQLSIENLEDPALAELRIGILGSPVRAALRSLGMDDNVIQWDIQSPYGDQYRLGNVVRAAALGEVDVAVAWGP